MEFKTCTFCGATKSMTTEYFSHKKVTKDGFSYQCKECDHKQNNTRYKVNPEKYLAMAKRYAENNREKVSQRNKKYVKSHPEIAKLAGRKYYYNHQEKCIEASRKYRREHPEYSKTTRLYKLAHPDKVKEWSKISYLRNGDKIRMRGAAYRERHRDEARERTRKYRIDNPEKIKLSRKRWQLANLDKCAINRHRRDALRKKLPSTLTVEQWRGILKKFNNRCACCGGEEIEGVLATKITQEHFIAVTKHGEYSHNNIIPTCTSCNSSKLNKDFFAWYPKYHHYSKKREKAILDHLNYKNGIQQLSLM